MKTTFVKPALAGIIALGTVLCHAERTPETFICGNRKIPVTHVPAADETESETRLLELFVKNHTCFDPDESILCFYADIDGDGGDEAMLTYSSSGRDGFFWTFFVAKSDDAGGWTLCSADADFPKNRRVPAFFEIESLPPVFLKTKKYPNGGFLTVRGWSDSDYGEKPLPKFPFHLRGFQIFTGDSVRFVQGTRQNANRNTLMIPEDFGETDAFFHDLFSKPLPSVPLNAYKIPSREKKLTPAFPRE